MNIFLTCLIQSNFANLQVVQRQIVPSTEPYFSQINMNITWTLLGLAAAGEDTQISVDVADEPQGTLVPRSAATVLTLESESMEVELSPNRRSHNLILVRAFWYKISLRRASTCRFCGLSTARKPTLE